MTKWLARFCIAFSIATVVVCAIPHGEYQRISYPVYIFALFMAFGITSALFEKLTESIKGANINAMAFLSVFPSIIALCDWYGFIHLAYFLCGDRAGWVYVTWLVYTTWIGTIAACVFPLLDIAFKR